MVLPLLAGASQLTEAEVLPGLAMTLVGIPGTLAAATFIAIMPRPISPNGEPVKLKVVAGNVVSEDSNSPDVNPENPLPLVAPKIAPTAVA